MRRVVDADTAARKLLSGERLITEDELAEVLGQVTPLIFVAQDAQVNQEVVDQARIAFHTFLEAFVQEKIEERSLSDWMERCSRGEKSGLWG